MRGKNEEWRTIQGWPKYAVSSLGKVKRLRSLDAKSRYEVPERVLVPVPVQSGADPSYRPLYVSLSNGGRASKFKIARLVLLTFRGPPTKVGENCARHLDDDQGNNYLSNLEWGSNDYNAKDRVKNGKSCCGSKNGNSRLTEAAVQQIRSMLAMGLPNTRIAKQMNVHHGTIARIRHGETWKEKR